MITRGGSSEPPAREGFVIIEDTYSVNQADKKIPQRLLDEVQTAVSSLSVLNTFKKISKEKTKQGKVLFSPTLLNRSLRADFMAKFWQDEVEYEGYAMDLIKDRVGLEIQFGKYAFVSHDFDKMMIYRNAGLLDYGIEIIPSNALNHKMSSGVPDFNSVVKHLRLRGSYDSDVPVLIVALGMTEVELTECSNIQFGPIEATPRALAGWELPEDDLENDDITRTSIE